MLQNRTDWRFLPFCLMVLSACASDDPPSASDDSANGTTGGDTLTGGTTAGDTSTGGSSGGSTGGVNVLIANRPYSLQQPIDNDDSVELPLVILLHGYTSNGASISTYYGFDQLVDTERFFLAYPDGTVDNVHQRFWNATDACCNFYNKNVDDVAYLNAIIDDVSQNHAVDSKRIYVAGHSNGGFMTHRMGCDAANRIAAIVSFSGAVWKDETKCAPTEKISVLHLHGTSDDTIEYEGGTLGSDGDYPGALETIATWATLNNCTPGSLPGLFDVDLTKLDLVSDLDGSETVVRPYSGCGDYAVELWTVKNGEHRPNLNTATWAAAAYGFLKAHPKP